MSKKTYRTFSLKNLQVCFKNEGGRRIEIIFRGGIQIDSTAKFVTDDEYLQERLEKSSGFGRDYYLESEVDTNPAPAPAPEKKKVEKAPAPAPEKKKVEKAPAPEKEIVSEMKDSRRFKNLVEMKNAMKELGIELGDDATYPKAKAAAVAAGYDFQIQKK